MAIPLSNHHEDQKLILWRVLFPRRAASAQTGEMFLWEI